MKDIVSITMRSPFHAHQISKLPKPTKAQTDEVRADFKKGIRCEVCGGWHHPKVIHLDYVGHAALTDRLLDVDAGWSWEPVAFDQTGLPALDSEGGLWIKLTVNGITRYGYGDAQGKTGGDAMKERIGDAMRNAAMRFGAALDLWHKGDLHIEEDTNKDKSVPKVDIPKAEMTDANKQLADLALYITDELAAGNDMKALVAYRTGLGIEGYHYDHQRTVTSFMDTSGKRKLKAIAEANPPAPQEPQKENS